MAKKTKPTKRARRNKQPKRKALKPPVFVEPDYCKVELEFTGAVRKDPETVRRLAHRVVDMLAETGHYKQLSQCVSFNLRWLVDGCVLDRVTALLEEARAAGKEASRG